MNDPFKAKGVSFYRDVVQKLMARGLIKPDMSLLAVCAGDRDREILQNAGLKNVTISNVDSRMTGGEFAPYAWSFQDAEKLTYEDNSFDITLVHAGLHHCRSPHRALLELYRVARKGVLVFENRDNMTLKAAGLLGFNKDYEIEAVVGNGCSYGGVGNTAIPNYIYRWTEREVQKTILSFAPETPHKISYFYGLRMPYQRLQMSRLRPLLFLAQCLEPPLRLTTAMFPRLANEFGFFIEKPALPTDLHAWLKMENGAVTIDRGWVSQRYREQG
ncbi:MAG TPA: methyltransferase domain-containing protein [Capsulimonadaceae bacterium]|nr:methyltransferase domain-containing protein [Capsulimonadaceae bacterium]